MRILWFTGVQLPALTGQGLTRAGWQEGLRKALENYQPEVELGIAAPGPTPRQPLALANTTYYTLLGDVPAGRWGRLRKAWSHASYTPVEYARCLELVASFKPDLVHFHGSENFFGLISERLTMPSLLSIQAIVNGYFPFFFSDLGWREIVQEIASPSFLRGEGPLHKWLTWRNYRQDEKQILAGCKNFIGRTAWDRAVLMAFNPKARYFECNEALADLYYTRTWHPEAAREAVVYSTSSGNYYKGSLLLARAVALLKQRGWKDIRLRLAGMNPRYDAGKILVKFIRANHLEENILMLERLSPEQITEEMLSAAVYVHPSHIDNSPNSLCEAMLLGLPCIAANAGGIPSLVRDGEDGLLYHDRDAYMLADRIAQLLSDRPLAARLGAQARQTALERHDREQIARRMVEVYRQVISPQPV
jgi:glycosyltransferase involved in cell wall biosynthesis